MTPDIEQLESASENDIVTINEDGTKVVNGSLIVDGNLNVSGQTTTSSLKVMEVGSATPYLNTNGRTI